MTQLEQNFFEAATKYCREHSYDWRYDKQIDWESRRYEIARDAMATLISSPNLSDTEIPKVAVEFADRLIEELKK